MKKIQFKDALKNIQKQFVSFVSIVLVIALGAGLFLVCRLGTLAADNAANEYYTERSFRDFEIKSVRGITEDDVKAVASLDFVKDAEGIISFGMVADAPGGREEVNVISPTRNIDKIVMIEGRFPEKAGECLITPETAEALGIGVNDVLNLYDDGTFESCLKADAFTVTGIMRHPAKIRLKEVSASCVLLASESFDTDALGVPFTGMLIKTTVDGDTFSARYREQIDALFNRLTIFSKDRILLRDESVKALTQEQIDKGESELREAAKMLDDAKKQAESGDAELYNAELQLEIARSTLELMKQQLSSSKEELDAGKEKLDKAKAELDAAKKKLDDGRRELDGAKAQLDKAALEIKENEAKIKEGEKELREGEKTLNEAAVRISAAKALIEEAETIVNASGELFNAVLTDVSADAAAKLYGVIPPIRELSENFGLSFDDVVIKLAVLGGAASAKIDQALEAVRNSAAFLQLEALYDALKNGAEDLKKGIEEYEAGVAEWNRGKEELENGKALLEKGKEEYNAGLALYLSKESEYSAGVMLYEANLAEYESGVAEYENGKKKYEEAEKQIAESEKTLSEKTAEFEKGKAEFEDGKKTLNEKEAEYLKGAEKLEEAKRALAAMGNGSWIILTRFQNLSFIDFMNTANVFENIGLTFSLLFVILGILVCYATIGKMIDEQKKLLGTVKALGYKPKEIFAKYLLFGVGGTVIGAVAGILLASFVLQPIMLGATKTTLHADTFHYEFEPVSAVLTLAVCAVIGITATYFACGTLLKKRTIALLNGEVKAVKAKEKTVEDGQKPRSLYAGLIWRNIKGDWKRAAITTASTAGCCMLLIIGFSLKFSFSGVITRQFDEIMKYDSVVTFLPDSDGKAAEKIGAILDETAENKLATYQLGTTVRIGGITETVQLIAADPDELLNFTSLYDINKERNVRIPDGGVMIFNRLAEVYRLSPGDRISILSPRGDYIDVPVSGIFKNYFGLSVYVSEDYAKEIFGDSCRINSYAVKNGADTEAAVKSALLKEKSFVQITTKPEMSERVEITSRSMNITVIVMIIMSAILAAVVLLNLVKMQINQKKRELTVMRINGFTIRETANYILKENVYLTLAGIALGIAVGAVASRINLAAVENIKFQMIRETSIPACLISAAITAVFAAVVNYLALRRIKHLELNHVD